MLVRPSVALRVHRGLTLFAAQQPSSHLGNAEPCSIAESSDTSEADGGKKRLRDEITADSTKPSRVKAEAGLVEASPPPPPAGTVRWRQDFIEKCVQTHYEQITFVGKVCTGACSSVVPHVRWV